MSLKQRLVVIMLVIANIMLLGAVWWVGSQVLDSLQGDEPQSGIAAGESVGIETETPLSPPLTSDAPTGPNLPPSLVPPRFTPTILPGYTPVIPGTALPGWNYYQNPERGFMIGMPPNWQIVELQPDRLKATVEMIRQKNPSIAADLESRVKSLPNLKFFSYDTATAPPVTPFLTNANLITDPLTEPISVDAYAQLSLKQLGKLKTLSAPIADRKLQLGAGQAHEFKYRILLVDGQGKPLMTSTVQYVVVHGSNAYILTLTTMDVLAAGYAGTFENIAASLVLKY